MVIGTITEVGVGTGATSHTTTTDTGRAHSTTGTGSGTAGSRTDLTAGGTAGTVTTCPLAMPPTSPPRARGSTPRLKGAVVVEVEGVGGTMGGIGMEEDVATGEGVEVAGGATLHQPVVMVSF